MRRRSAYPIVMLFTIVALACSPAGQATTTVTQTRIETETLRLPNDPHIAVTLSDPLSCTERVALPQIEDPFDARWADDSHTIAVSRIVTIPNRRMITGTEEDQRVSVLDLAKSSVRDLGQGSKPTWSGSGTYLAYWRGGEDDLRIVRGDALAGLVPTTQPNVRWVGDTLYFFHDGEIRVWKDGLSWTVANVLEDLAPHYPHDDVYFSADAVRFTMTRYFPNGSTERYLGTTATGVMERFADDDTLFTEWSPVGHALLLRSATTVTLRPENGADRMAAVTTLAGPVHAWTADGRLLFGKMSATMPGESAFDKFSLFGDAATVAALPNLLGVRSFSPDGRYFMGVTRTSLYSTQLEVYHCGTVAAPAADPRADPAARARAASIDADVRRFVRPVSGAITQYVQGSHTGIDVSAPFGAIIDAADDGVVSAVGWVPGGGRGVCVTHGGGLESCDYHISLPLVSVGDHVLRGQPVALVGMTGLTSAPHVHWEAKRNGRIVDPLKQ